jgi:hypothetical protein
MPLLLTPAVIRYVDYNAYVDPLETLLLKMSEEREEHMLDMLEEMGQFFNGMGGAGGTRGSVRHISARRKLSGSGKHGSPGGGRPGPPPSTPKSAKGTFGKQLPGGSGRHSGRGTPQPSAPAADVRNSPQQLPGGPPPAQQPAGRTGKRKSIMVMPKFFGGKSSPPKEDEEIEPSLPFPSGIESLTLTFDAIHTFFDKDANRELQRNLDGYDHLDIKGLLYWKERLKKYIIKLDMLKNLIQAQLDEKRNFMSFMLTIITTVLAPLTIVTGYFGMNFDNMIELDKETYPAMPGVVLMWFVCAIAYGLLLLAAFHFRVIYSAT